jgi:UMF1 family MFS transporter
VTDRARHGWYLYGWASHAFPTIVVTVFMSRYLTSVAENAVGKNGRVHVLGIPIAPGSLFSYTITASTILLVVLMPVIGAVADRSGRKRDIMLGCGWVGAAACVAMVAVTSTAWQLGAILFAIAYVAYSCSIVVSYSLLIDLSTSEDRDHASSVGWALAYIGGGLLLAIDFALSLFVDKSTLARIALCTAGVWWILFSLPVRRWLPEYLGPGRSSPRRGSALRQGFSELAGTLRHMRAFPLTLAFLGAFLVYNDGIQTVIALASQYGTKELGLSDDVLVPTILMVQFLAFAGALLLGWMAKRIGAWKTLLLSLVLWTVVILVAYFLPAHQALPFVALGGGIGLVLGGSQALSRSLFSQLIPKGREGEYFGIYEISDKGTSWLGPLLFGLAYDTTRSYRVAIISLLVFFVVGFVALLAVPIRKAIEQAGNTPPARL